MWMTVVFSWFNHAILLRTLFVLVFSFIMCDYCWLNNFLLGEQYTRQYSCLQCTNSPLNQDHTTTH
eukprot:m.54758 g.54758  ORF g.54758 m.54758 type:complete len:66 (-) comp11447_c0_seq1:988-1185(-)